MRRQFHDTWGVFRPARHVFENYFGVRRNPHAQETIFPQITACGANFMVPGHFPTYRARFSELFRCISEPSCLGDDFLENHSM